MPRQKKEKKQRGAVKPKHSRARAVTKVRFDTFLRDPRVYAREPRSRVHAARDEEAVRGAREPYPVLEAVRTDLDDTSRRILANQLPLKVKASSANAYRDAWRRVRRWAEVHMDIPDCTADPNSALRAIEGWRAAGKGPSTWELALSHEELSDAHDPRFGQGTPPALTHKGVRKYIDAFSKEWNRVSRRVRPSLTPADFKRLLEWVPTRGEIWDPEHFIGMLRFLWAFGCRISEFLSARPEDFDVKAKTWFLREHKADDTNQATPVVWAGVHKKDALVDVDKAARWAAGRTKRLQYDSLGNKYSQGWVREILILAQEDLGIEFDEERTSGKLASHVFRKGRSLECLRLGIAKNTARQFLRMSERIFSLYAQS